MSSQGDAIAAPPRQRQAKIAYGIQVHDNPQQFWWLYQAIYNPWDVFSVHIDQKTPEASYRSFLDIIGSGDNIHFLPRTSVAWGGWSQARIELDAIAALLQADKDWTHFINISGRCYPLTSRRRRIGFLSAAPWMNFLQSVPISTRPAVRTRIRWSHEETPDGVVRTDRKKAPPVGFRVEHNGEAWHVLSRPFCEWIVSSKLSRDIFEFFTDTGHPDECVVQTLLANSPFRDTLGPCQWHAEWQPGAPHPETLTMRDQLTLVCSDRLFARKFDEAVDCDILHELAQSIGAPRKPATRESQADTGR